MLPRPLAPVGLCFHYPGVRESKLEDRKGGPSGSLARVVFPVTSCFFFIFTFSDTHPCPIHKPSRVTF